MLRAEVSDSEILECNSKTPGLTGSKQRVEVHGGASVHSVKGIQLDEVELLE